NAGDLILVMYGGSTNTEYYRDLGATSNTATSFTVDPSIMSQLGTGVKFTLVGANSPTPNFPSPATFTFEGTRIPTTNTGSLTGWNDARNQLIDQNQYVNTLINWRGQSQTIPGSEEVSSAAAVTSWSHFFGTGGTLNSAFPRPMENQIGDVGGTLNPLFLLGR